MTRGRTACWAGLAALLTLGLTGCAGGARATQAGWTPKPVCATPAAVAGASTLPTLGFTVRTAKPETPAGTGCSYESADGAVKIDVERDPGAPSEVQFGSAAHLTITKAPALGSGAETARSSSFCALVVPASGNATLQIQIINSGRTSITSACERLPQLLTRFASRPTASPAR